MLKTLHLITEIPPDREVRIVLPDDVPVGPAEVSLTLRPVAGAAARTLGDLAQSEFFGIWKDRTDIIDSAAFARQLREEAWKRPQ
jgi:hypothetical protein